jgi:cytochrome c oxidase subunit 2
MHIDRLERYWIIAVTAMLGVFMAALFVSVVVFRVQLPSPVGRVDPRALAETEFATPGLTDLGASRYDMHIVAKMWNFDLGQAKGEPAEVRLPRGAQVTFFVTSEDVTHGFFIEGHDASLMLLPGQIASATVRFNRPGTYHIICHEYCGPAHANMVAAIIVE